MHIFEIKIMKKNLYEKIDFRVQNPPNAYGAVGHQYLILAH